MGRKDCTGLLVGLEFRLGLRFFAGRQMVFRFGAKKSGGGGVPELGQLVVDWPVTPSKIGPPCLGLLSPGGATREVEDKEGLG